MTNRLAWILALATLTTAGCIGASGRSRSAPPVFDRIDRLSLMAAVLSDATGSPGSDGVSVRLTMYKTDKGKLLTGSADGNVEFLIYDGSVGQSHLAAAVPFHTWTVTPEHMRQFRARSYGLWCYELSLRWPPPGPSGVVVTIIARYLTPNGTYVYSAPVAVRDRVGLGRGGEY